MAKIVYVNKQLEELYFESIEGVANTEGFQLTIHNKKINILHNSDFSSPNIDVTVKKKLFKGYIIKLHMSYGGNNGVYVIDETLNPTEPLKLLSDANEYAEWILQSISDAFNGEW